MHTHEATMLTAKAVKILNVGTSSKEIKRFVNLFQHSMT